jgi:capsular exopolysaccharide synthesis family protein
MEKVSLAIQTAEAKVQGEIAKVVQSTRNDFLAAQGQERSLVDALEQQKRDALELNRKGIDYSALQRDAVSNRQIFDGLLQRTKETGIVGELKSSHIRIVDPAEVPRSPASPNKRLGLLFGLGGGLFVALGLTFFFEYMDSHIKSPEEIRVHLGLTDLGMLPLLQQTGGRYPLLSGGVPANFSEALRTLRTNLLFSSAEEGGRALVVTSTAPREGKSLVSSNLAIALAQAGQRTLLVDADLRKPKAHDIFALSEEPGLSNVLVGDAPLKTAIRETTVPGLSVLVAGRIPPNPTELLGAPRFRELMTTLRTHFDWTIVDTPPVMAVADATLVAHLATGVVFVVGAEMTSRHAAKRALDQLQHVHAKFVGGVLNKVDLHRNPYYYSQYYRREYAQYYIKAS